MTQDDAAERSPEPTRDGWTRRFTAIGARLQEAVDLYHGLGFEIRLEPADANPEDIADRSACAQCFVMTLAQTIYTRPTAHPIARPLAAPVNGGNQGGESDDIAPAAEAAER